MQKEISKKDFFKLMNNEIFRKKTMENVRNHREIKLITPKARRNYLISETNLQQKRFQEIY